MLLKNWLSLIVILCICVGLSAGCRTSRIDGEDSLSPVDVLDGDYPLASWADDLGEFVEDVSFDRVLFAFDNAQIGPGERYKIESVAQYLKRHRKHRTILEGHCDERGSREYNMALGERRGLAVRSYLIQLGVASERLTTRSYGEEKPAAPGHSEASWRLSRRVEFAIYH